MKGGEYSGGLGQGTRSAKDKGVLRSNKKIMEVQGVSKGVKEEEGYKGYRRMQGGKVSRWIEEEKLRGMCSSPRIENERS
ncbi:hypothetical protein Tco_1079727 [Tanacetum coccineum]|uniref:Uncharacterized protein n=1 Tax=Tanacetum coccineum TaxID=301880 RepID=A0ABQ5HUD6_9ASTR